MPPPCGVAEAAGSLPSLLLARAGRRRSPCAPSAHVAGRSQGATTQPAARQPQAAARHPPTARLTREPGGALRVRLARPLAQATRIQLTATAGCRRAGSSPRRGPHCACNCLCRHATEVGRPPPPTTQADSRNARRRGTVGRLRARATGSALSRRRRRARPRRRGRQRSRSCPSPRQTARCGVGWPRRRSGVHPQCSRRPRAPPGCSSPPCTGVCAPRPGPPPPAPRLAVYPNPACLRAGEGPPPLAAAAADAGAARRRVAARGPTVARTLRRTRAGVGLPQGRLPRGRAGCGARRAGRVPGAPRALPIRSRTAAPPSGSGACLRRATASARRYVRGPCGGQVGLRVEFGEVVRLVGALPASPGIPPQAQSSARLYLSRAHAPLAAQAATSAWGRGSPPRPSP